MLKLSIQPWHSLCNENFAFLKYKISIQISEILNTLSEGDGFLSKKLLEKAYFIVRMTGPADQFWLLENSLRLEKCQPILKPNLKETSV